jgi:pyrroline-5-carboxylate reductase
MASIAFLGAGNIAQAIMGGLVESGTPPSDLITFDPVDACRDKAADLGIRMAKDNDDAVAASDLIMLCVKPNVMLDLLSQLKPPVGKKIFISVAAGITTGQIAEKLGGSTAIIRCMPNTPALVQTGMTALFATESVSEAGRFQATDILGTVGETLWVEDESQLDAVTAVSGSGPAYYFLLMETMIAAAEREGLDNVTATQLVLQTALGAARMAAASGDSPGVLRQNVTSPGGTTQAALDTFLDAGFPDLVEKAVHAARIRSVALSKGS